MNLTTPVRVLDFLILNTQEPLYANALCAGRDALIREQSTSAKSATDPDDWPYCSKCQKPYVGQRIEGVDFIRNVLPGCRCRAPVMWGRRGPKEKW